MINYLELLSLSSIKRCLVIVTQIPYSAQRSFEILLSKAVKVIIFVTLPFMLYITQAYADSNPVINIWYGASQVFGQIGNPQKWVNILGKVTDEDGIASLVYSLNGDIELPLTIGPDDRRLDAEGDFNIEIDITDLIAGTNLVVITAKDDLGYQSSETVEVEYVDGKVWPRTYKIDWSATQNIQEVVQIVDGYWILEGNSIRSIARGYDRLIAIGDMVWDNYEVTVPITMHSHGVSYGVGILLRWIGHYDWDGSQPRWGWYPIGALGWFRNGKLVLQGGGTSLHIEDDSFTLTPGDCYIFKMRVEKIPEQGFKYSFKIWKDGLTEPSKWNLLGQEDTGDLQNGSILLVSHWVDASFGPVSVRPINTAAVVPIILLLAE